MDPGCYYLWLCLGIPCIILPMYNACSVLHAVFLLRLFTELFLVNCCFTVHLWHIPFCDH